VVINRHQTNLIRLDKFATLRNPDVVWDLDKFPYPFNDSSFSEKLNAFDVIEHFRNIHKL
jgi:hypothetical protein